MLNWSDTLLGAGDFSNLSVIYYKDELNCSTNRYGLIVLIWSMKEVLTKNITGRQNRHVKK